jgi:hypothetical protein
MATEEATGENHMTGRNDIDGDLQDIEPNVETTNESPNAALIARLHSMGNGDDLPELLIAAADVIEAQDKALAEARVQALTEVIEVIEKAEHGSKCGTRGWLSPEAVEAHKNDCTCWKSTALAAVKGGE